MKKKQILIPVIAFIIAITAAVSSNATTTAATAAYGLSSSGQCMTSSGTLQSNCSILSLGSPCSVILDTGEIAPAYLLQAGPYICLLPLRQPN